VDRVTASAPTTPTPATPPAAPAPRALDKRNIVEVHDLKVHFPIRAGIFKSVKGTVKAVDGVDFEVRRGETLGLVGESGCGKSTIGRAMIRLREPTAGQVYFDGVDLGSLDTNALRAMRRRMQIIFQDPYGSLDPRMTVASIINEPLEVHNLAEGKGGKRERVAELLRLVGLDPAFVSRYPHEFSGGQRQRIGVARALAVEPEFIVCDEPISALDVSIQAQVLNLLTDLRERLGLTYLFVAHDLSVVKHISDRVAVMYLGKIVEVGPPDQLYTTPGHPYTRALLSAVPVPDPNAERKRKRVILKGDVPSPVNPPPGCRFHTRCWLYERLGQPENCRTVEPLLTVLEGEHRVACHYADEALKTDVGIAHIADRPVRHGTPAKAIASLAAVGIDIDAPKEPVLEAPVAEALDQTLLTSTTPLEGFQAPESVEDAEPPKDS
jgi:oligopeptide transport system ATP-binding protein